MNLAPRPPRLGRWLLRRFVPGGAARDGLSGDLEEMYRDRLHDDDTPPNGGALWRRLSADAWFLTEAFFAALRYRPWADRLAAAVRGDRARRFSPRDLAGELRLALRQLARTPAFAAASIFTLALAIAATAVIFTVVRGVILAPLPFPDADRLVVIEHRLPGYPTENGEVVFGAFQGQVIQYAERSRELLEIGAFGTFDGAVTAPDAVEMIRLGYATAGFFRALGVTPASGRLFDADEPAAGAGRGAAIVSHALARQRYGEIEGVPGAVIETEGFEYEIRAVLPPAPAFPADQVAVWHARSDQVLRDNLEWTVDALVGRMAPAATAQSVERELAGLVADIPDRFAGTAIDSVARDGRMAPRVTPMKQWLLGDARAALWLLLAAVLVVLAIAGVNVGNLMIVRTNARRDELELRVALGARSSHIYRYFLIEAAAIGAAAGALALLGAAAAVRALPYLTPVTLPRFEEVDAAAAVLPVVILTLAMIAGLAAVPVLALRGVSASTRRGPIGRAYGASREQRRARNLMVSLQLAMALVLLVGAGLILRSAQALSTVDPGFRAPGVLTFRVAFPYREIVENPAGGVRATLFYDALQERIEALPGVNGVGYGICIPMAPTCSLDGYPVKPEEATAGAVAERPLAGLQPVSPGFTDALGIRLVAGRRLEQADHRQRSNAVLVNAALAQRLWPGEDPLGRRLEQGGGSPEQNHHFTVVGVVDDVRFDRLRDEPEYVVYTPVLLRGTSRELYGASFVVRGEVAPQSLVDDVRAAVAALRNDVPVAEIHTMDALMARSIAHLRFVLALLVGASIAALALSALGVFGVVSYVVGLRRAEFGVRLALGARPRDVLRLVLRDGSGMTVAGVLMGTAGAVLLTRYLSAFLFEIPPLDPLSFGAAAALLLVVGIGACWIPARRASRVDPVRTLGNL